MLLNLSKLFLALLILYAGYFQNVFFQIPNMLLILGFFTILFLLILMYQKSTPISYGFTLEIVLWIVFAIISLSVGCLTVMEPNHLVTSIITLVEDLILIVVICFICKYDGNTDYIVKVFIVLALMSAVTTIFFGEGYRGSTQISLTSNTNPNELGILLAIGIFCLLHKFDANKKLNMVFVFVGILIFLYTIILTGSRKSFLAAILLLIYWFLFCLGGVLKKANFGTKMGTIVLILIAIVFSIYFIVPIFDGSVLFQRLICLFGQGDAIRIGMYNEAYQFFLSSPLFGIGYKNYELLSIYQTYSHSTYAEALACTGLFGTLFYFSAYVTMAVKTVKIITNKHLNYDIHVRAKTILGIFMIMVFLGTGTIHFYEISSSVVFAIIISFNKLYYEFKRRLVLK